MRCVLATACFAGLLLFGGQSSAHRVDEYLQATLLSVKADRIEASMRLVPGESVAPSVIAAIDSDGNGVFSETEQRAYAQSVLADLVTTVEANVVDPKLVSWSFPPPASMRQGLGEIHIDYAVALPPGRGERSFVVANRHRAENSVYLVNVLASSIPGIDIVAQKRNAQQSLYELDYRQDAGATPSLVAPQGGDLAGRWRGLEVSSLFRLGMRHIAEGIDHLMFLLTLLLAAPLAARGPRWSAPLGVRRSLSRVLGIVTAFTAGHSVTLVLAALGGPTLPTRLVEVMIAVSILVSAVHALRPLFAGREAWVAGFFGMIHGLAFAATLDHLGFGFGQRVVGTLAFNAGIEAMQLVVVAAVLPSLLLMSRTSGYGALRVGGAALAAAASTAWIVEQTLAVDARMDMLAQAVARAAPAIAASLFLASLACFALMKFVAEPRVVSTFRKNFSDGGVFPWNL